MEERVRRSWLLVPVDNADRVGEATSVGADVVVLDLEDTVHESKKHQARGRVKDAIPEMCSRGSEVFVRSDLELLYADLEASVWHGLTGVILPRVTTVEQVQEADQILAEFEAQRGVVKPPPVGEIMEADDPRGPEQALEIHLSLDTGRGNWDVVKLVEASSRVRSISLGRADLVMDLREEPSGDLHLMPYLMQRLITIANATGVQPIGAWWRATSRGLVANPEDTLQAATTGRQAGFRGALCMRASQAEPLNRGFTPSDEEKARASAVIGAFAAARAEGKATAVVDGEIVNAGRAAGAARLLEWAEACQARDEAKARVAETAG
ncbi:HpcH/HpaI aldolase/citrate lyase family protein [Chloroflexota bacterium]